MLLFFRGRQKKGGSVASNLPPSLQPIAIKPKKPSSNHHQLTPHQHAGGGGSPSLMAGSFHRSENSSNSNSDKRQLAHQMSHNSSRNNGSDTFHHHSQYYPVHARGGKSVGTAGNALNVGHINDDDDEDMPSVTSAHNGGAPLDLTKNGSAVNLAHTSAPPTSIPHSVTVTPKDAWHHNDVLISTPTFSLSIPSFTVGPAPASQQPTSAPTQVSGLQGCETDSGVLVIDEDYEC